MDEKTIKKEHAQEIAKKIFDDISSAKYGGVDIMQCGANDENSKCSECGSFPGCYYARLLIEIDDKYFFGFKVL